MIEKFMQTIKNITWTQEFALSIAIGVLFTLGMVVIIHVLVYLE